MKLRCTGASKTYARCGKDKEAKTYWLGHDVLFPAGFVFDVVANGNKTSIFSKLEVCISGVCLGGNFCIDYIAKARANAQWER